MQTYQNIVRNSYLFFFFSGLLRPGSVFSSDSKGNFWLRAINYKTVVMKNCFLTWAVCLTGVAVVCSLVNFYGTLRTVQFYRLMLETIDLVCSYHDCLEGDVYIALINSWDRCKSKD